MSYKHYKILFWFFKTHEHEWEELFREWGEMVTYSSGLTGRRELGSRAITVIHWVCKECGDEREETKTGHRDI